MKRRNPSNNPVFREIRELEQKALEAGILKQSDIKTSEAMRKEAWSIYLGTRKSFLISQLKDIQGGAE